MYGTYWGFQKVPDHLHITKIESYDSCKLGNFEKMHEIQFEQIWIFGLMSLSFKVQTCSWPHNRLLNPLIYFYVFLFLFISFYFDFYSFKSKINQIKYQINDTRLGSILNQIMSPISHTHAKKSWEIMNIGFDTRLSSKRYVSMQKKSNQIFCHEIQIFDSCLLT